MRAGTLLAAAGVACFSLTFPATVWALEGFGPWGTTGLRGVLAALLAGAWLLKARIPVPARRHWPSLLVVAAGCVIGFPLLTTLALQISSTAHSAVVVGILPLATAAISAVRTGKRPSRMFWAAAITGASAVIAFTVEQSHGRPVRPAARRAPVAGGTGHRDGRPRLHSRHPAHLAVRPRLGDWVVDAKVGGDRWICSSGGDVRS